MDARLILYMLDSAHGHPLQFWSFESRDLVRIGRAIDNDVIVSHPCVSRAHAYVSLEHGEWLVSALSEQGIFHLDRKVPQLRLEQGFVFRLGPNGPSLRFASSAVDPEEAATVNLDQEPLFSLSLDRAKLAEDVNRITEGEYFQRLRASLGKLRSD